MGALLLYGIHVDLDRLGGFRKELVAGFEGRGKCSLLDFCDEELQVVDDGGVRELSDVGTIRMFHQGQEQETGGWEAVVDHLMM